ncbi:MAG: hypothetical protein UW23_C0026G0011 [Candidatus Collierbacteria bacterium GW2011_GWA1_44_12]|uniref:Uncharacterized protein n=1 Tax=Candidatus Collierbacteria bacterium GW2011_GWA1_44_12 TaxID=1618376 RepID=A0A0G1GIZ6_9BACT|nr:MAG: hypothetical protein UW23_C0026G0011 [Candidatus Collierbacteria bacterium GW2011_GWA1_44_12]
MKNKFPALFLIVLSVTLLTACSDPYPESSQVIEINDTALEGKSIRILRISPDERYIDVKQNLIVPELVDTINSGELNIISVKTGYTGAFLTSADITYDNSGPGKGNALRIKLLILETRYIDVRDKELSPQLDEFVNSGQYDIVKIQTTYVEGYLVAAEIYYYEED